MAPCHRTHSDAEITASRKRPTRTRHPWTPMASLSRAGVFLGGRLFLAAQGPCRAQHRAGVSERHRHLHKPICCSSYIRLPSLRGGMWIGWQVTQGRQGSAPKVARVLDGAACGLGVHKGRRGTSRPSVFPDLPLWVVQVSLVRRPAERHRPLCEVSEDLGREGVREAVEPVSWYRVEAP